MPLQTRENKPIKTRCQYRQRNSKWVWKLLQTSLQFKQVLSNELTNFVFFSSQTDKKLNLTEQKGCEDLLNKAECLKALKDMECNKIPGSDSLPAEFYKVFWNDISDLFLN